MFACQYCGGMREPGYFVCPHCRTQNGTPFFQSGNSSRPPINYDHNNQHRHSNQPAPPGYGWFCFFVFFVIPLIFVIIAQVNYDAS
jgi:hypothetical protein